MARFSRSNRKARRDMAGLRAPHAAASLRAPLDTDPYRDPEPGRTDLPF
ncbi:hypothetical protein R5H30_20355 [Sulfitobacter sp. D35]|nr:hypothetical protein [Sulfitobacter sp. D35]MDW4500352.1 hypothetical protein [Sulfitobacter sp. D35]